MDPLQTSGQQQDPDAIRRLLMQRMFGGAGAPSSVPAGVPPNQPQPGMPASPMATPAAPAKPAAAPLSNATANTTGPAEPGNQAPPLLSEADYNKQNPQAPHTPYQAPQEYIDRYASIQDPTRRTYAAMIA